MTAMAQNYTAQKMNEKGVDIVRLRDAAHDVEVSVVPSIGNRAYEMKVHGKNILYFGNTDVGDFKERPRLSGIPFLAPWADLLSEPGFWANGKHYVFNKELGNIRGDRPSHGFLVTSPYWHVTEVAADAKSAHVTSKLEFWKYPDLMAQWPFAHEYEMTYSLADGMLEVKTVVSNLSTEAMPIILGYHSFYQVPDIPRDEWNMRIPARIHVIPGEHNIPTGEMRPLDIPNPMLLKGQKLDEGFTDFERDANGRAHFSIEAGGKRVETLVGPKFNVVTIWLPSGPDGQPREFICFEPLTTIIAGVNLAHEGKWNGLQTVPGGGQWTESFWVRSDGI
jgi:aldose 1-epimerase